MSTSLLYHAFGLKGCYYSRTDYQQGSILFHLDLYDDQLRCSRCHSSEVIRRGSQERVFRAVPIGGKRVDLVFAVPRVECKLCGSIRQVPLGFADARRSYTHQFERYALDLLRHMTIQDVARHLQISWDVIKEIQKRYLQRRFGQPKLKRLQQIAIDEIAVSKGHKYLTVVLDLRSGAVVFVGDGKGAEALAPFWKRLRRAGAKIKAVALDMSPAYIEAVTNNLKGVPIVFDHFHVIKLFNEKLSNLRRDLYREATDMLQKKVLKGSRWLLLKNPENLEEQRNEQERLQEALKLNEPLAAAYYMKEELRAFWQQPNRKTAAAFLDDWCARARASGIKMLSKFAATLSAHRTGLLNYHNYSITTAALEGTNNKIKTMKRQAYGFRDMEFFKLKILGLHETKYALVG
jgi:transposase